MKVPLREVQALVVRQLLAARAVSLPNGPSPRSASEPVASGGVGSAVASR